jgi:uncharacterized protein
MIAHSGSHTIGSVMFARWPLLLATVLAIIIASTIVGWLLARRGLLPGAVAVWGSTPGAANVIMLMADAHGADIRLVAFMQYLRGTSKNRRFPPPRKSDSRLSCSERGRLAWDSLASSI